MRNLKRILSVIMLILMLFNIIQPVFAVSGSGKWAGGQYDSGMKTTDNQNQQYGVLIRRLINTSSGERKTVFCAEHGVQFKTGVSYNGIYYTPTDSTLRRACKVAYLGWYKNNGDYVIDGGILAADMKWVKWEYVFTQQYIWEILGQSSATFLNADEQRGYEDFKVRINNELNQKSLRPSFNNQTITLNAGENKRITDTNGVLAEYNSIDVTQDGIRYQHSKGSNDFTITVDENIAIENINVSDDTFESWGMIKDGTEDYDTTVYFEFASGVQNQLYAMQYNDPVSLNIKLQINNYGRLELQKLNTNGDLIDGAVFNVTGPNGFNQDVVVTNGKIVIEKLPKGTYYINEKLVPNGYLIDTRTYQAEVVPNKTLKQVITNSEPTGKILIYKVNENNDKVGGAKFIITAAEDIKNVAGTKTFYTKNQEVAQITSANDTGIAQIDNLPIGKYNVKEIEAPIGYLLNTNTYTANLEYKDSTTPVVELKIEGVVNNEPTGKILIYKTSENNDKVGGAKFIITAAEDIKNVAGTKTFYTKNQEVAQITSANDTGIAQIDNLPIGKYNVKEIEAPIGYLLNTNTYTANLVYKDATTPVVELKIEGVVNNEPTGKILIYKTSENNDKVGGAKFIITAAEDIKNVAGTKTFYTKNQEVAQITSANDTGIAQIDNLPMGKYYVKEIQAPKGYLLNTKTYTANLEYKDATTPVVELKIKGVVNNEPTGKILIYKTSENNDKVGGAKFIITAAEDIKNVAGTKTFYTKNQEVAQITSAIGTGIAQIDNLPMGKYYVKEIQAPKGYLLNSKTYTANLEYKDATTPVVELKIEGVVNNEPTGKILIYKTSENNDKVGDAIFSITAAEDIKNVAGTKTFYTKNQEVAQITSAIGTGIAQIDNLPMGKYYVKEIQAPKGYLLNSKTYTANLVYKDQNTPVIEIKIEGVINNEPTGTITIIKKDSETGAIAQGDATLENAIYKVYANEDIYNVAKSKKFFSKGDLIATRTTDKSGYTTDVEELPLGKYIVKEETAPVGYLVDTKVYEVNLVYKDQHTKVITGNANSIDKVKKMGVHIFKSGIKVNSGETPGLAGSEFTIKLKSDVEKAYAQGYTYEEIWNGIDEYGNTVSVNSSKVAKAQVIAPTYESIVTDEKGNAYTQNKLPYGTYIVKETNTPKDYESAVDFTFSITQDESEIEDVAKKVKHLFVNNEQLETYIKLIKKDLKTEKIVSLSNATFQIKATRDIYDRATGKILYKKGEAITQKIGSTTYNSFTTNAKNMVVPANSYSNKIDLFGSVVTPLKLEVGSYEITEIKIPNGFLQLEKPVTFKVEGLRDYDTDQDGDYIKEIVIKNEKPTGTLIIDKNIDLRENIDKSLIDTSDLSGVQFKFSAKENIIDPTDGSIIYKKGQEIKVYNLDKNGDLKVEDIPVGTYEIQEVKTLDGLVLDDTKHEIKFTQKDTITKVYTEIRNLVNNTTLAEISKQDITGDKELESAKLQVIDSKGKVIDEWISTDKPHTIEGLIVGNEYTLRETIVPKGFVKSTDIKFKIENTTETHKIKMIDKVVEMTKVDIGGEELEGAKIQVLNKDNEIVDEWVSSKEPHKINNLVENESYRIHEEIAIEGYVKATDVQFTVTEDKETQKVQMIDKIVEMTKTDIGGDEVEGAEMSVTDENGEVVDSWVSTKEPHHISGLEEGKTYVLHELVAPDGFVKATDVEFIVTEDKETQKLQMIDKIVQVTKTDLTNGEELEGAELVVTDEDGNVIDEWTSTKEPHHISGLEEGKKYILTEKTAPYGYETTESITFTVTEDKETQVIEMKDMPILKTIKIIKADSSTKEVIKDDFKFGIYEDAECTKLIKEVKSNKDDGTVTFEDLRFGTYYIKESKQPNGYQLSDEVLKLEINDKGVSIDNTEIEEKDNIYSFTFYNELIPKIQTGNEMNYILLATLMGLSLIGITTEIVVLKRKNRKDK